VQEMPDLITIKQSSILYIFSDIQHISFAERAVMAFYVS